MCISYEASISAWFIAFLASVYMLANNSVYDIWLPLFILVFTQIQIVEAIIWVSMSTNDNINSSSTKILSFLLWLQPFINSYIAFTQTGNSFLLAMTIFYGFMLIYHYFSSSQDKFISTVGPNGHLVWNRYSEDGEQVTHVLGSGFMTFIYLFGLFVPFLFMENVLMRNITIFIGLLTFTITIINYQSEFSSMWCFTAVVLVLVALVFNKKN